MEREVVIVSGARTPIGSFLGGLKELKAQSMGAIAIRETIRRAGIEDSLIDEVIIGNIIQIDPRGNPAKEAILEAGLPFEIPAFTVNKNCASGIKSVSLAATMVKYGEADVILAGGMDSMTRSPYLLRNARSGFRMGTSVANDLLTDLLEGMGMTAERLAEKYNISREEQDEFAYFSQMKAAKAQSEGKFTQEIVSVSIPQKRGALVTIDKDEGIIANTTLEKLGKLKPAFKKDGTVTPGNSSTINDAAAAMLIMSAEKANELGLKPLAKITGWASAGCDPSIMGIGPVPSTRILMKKLGMSVNDFDLIELNEAFAAQAIAVIRELKLDTNKVNVNGGAISIGHPVGATGTILIMKLIHEMKRRKVQNGLVTLCIGGGQGMSIAIQNL